MDADLSHHVNNQSNLAQIHYRLHQVAIFKDSGNKNKQMPTSSQAPDIFREQALKAGHFTGNSPAESLILLLRQLSERIIRI